MNRQELIKAAEAAGILLKRYEEERIRWYKPASEKHRMFHFSDKMIRIVFGGNRSGKSIVGLMELLFHACFVKHPFTKEPNRTPGRYRIFTTKYQIAEEHVIPLLQLWIPKKCLRGGSWATAYDSRYHIVHFQNGTVIDILTYDTDVVGTASVELDGVWADEEMPERMYAETITRLISRKGKFWMTVTPLYNLSWALPFWNKTEDPNVEVFRFSIHDNGHLPEKEKNAIISQWPENERKARELGEFLEFQGVVFKELQPSVHYIPEDSKLPKNGWPVVMTMDPHQRKATAITWAYVDPHDNVVFFDELEIKGTAKDIVKAVKEKEKQHNARTMLRIIDPAADKQFGGIGSDITTLDEFEKEGMGFTLAYNNQEAGNNIVHEYLAWDDKQPLGPMNHPMCYFTHACPKTWHGMTSLLWDEWKFRADLRDEKERVKDFKKDFPDCVRYTLALRPKHNDSMQPIAYGNKTNTRKKNLRDMFLRSKTRG